MKAERGGELAGFNEFVIEPFLAIGFFGFHGQAQRVLFGFVLHDAVLGAVVAEEGHEDIVIFDVSMRIPGSPGTMFTPYSGYLYRKNISYGERIAMEIKKAVKNDKLGLICT